MTIWVKYVKQNYTCQNSAVWGAYRSQMHISTISLLSKRRHLKILLQKNFVKTKLYLCCQNGATSRFSYRLGAKNFVKCNSILLNQVCLSVALHCCDQQQVLSFINQVCLSVALYTAMTSNQFYFIFIGKTLSFALTLGLMQRYNAFSHMFYAISYFYMQIVLLYAIYTFIRTM